ncbi:type IV secretion system protein [Burkholderia stagnalis]
MAMDDAFLQGMWSYIDSQADVMASTYYVRLAVKTLPVAALIATIWVGVKVLRVHSGRDPADIWPMVRMMLTILLIFAGLGGGGLKIYQMFTELRDVTSAVLTGNKTLIQYVDDVSKQILAISDYLMSASVWNIGVVLLGYTIAIIFACLTVVIMGLHAAAVMGLVITFTVGPLFLPTLFWQATRSYGMSWFAAMLKFTLIGILLVLCVVFAFGLALHFMNDASGVLQTEVAQVKVADALAIIVLEIFMLLFCIFNVKPLASALSSSGAAAAGIAEMAAGMMVNTIFSKFLGGNSSGGRGGGGASLPQLAQGQAAMQQQLSRIESALGGSGGSGTGSASARAMQDPPSGAGQPGASAGAGGSGEGPRW